jgi:arylsulfatase A
MNTRLLSAIVLLFVGLVASVESVSAAERQDKPNIIFILADDMGFGDVAHAGGLAATPHVDRLAAEGMRFTDAHTTSSVCTPTRYSILTGRYNWRTRLKKSVLFGLDTPLIPASRTTVASFLRQRGYHTGIVGKWHLGLGWQKLPNGEKRQAEAGPTKGGGWDIDYSKPVTGGPNTLGFDQSFIIPASLDMFPYVYLRDDKAIQPATLTKAFHRAGPAGEPAS